MFLYITKNKAQEPDKIPQLATKWNSSSKEFTHTWTLKILDMYVHLIATPSGFKKPLMKPTCNSGFG